MERDDAISAVEKLVDLFPSTNEVQAREWLAIFENYPEATVDAAIQTYYRSGNNGGFLDGLMVVLRKQYDLDRAVLDDQRQARKRTESQWLAECDAVERTIAAMSDDDLKPLWDQVVAEMRADVESGRLAEWLFAQRMRNGPRANKWVKARIYALLDAPVTTTGSEV